MPPTTAPARPAVTIQHRAQLVQVHVAPWDGSGGNHDDKDSHGDPFPLHMHIQDTAGGAGKVVPLTHPLARELARYHPEVRAIGGELPEDQEARLEAERELQAAIDAQGQAEAQAQAEARERAEFKAYQDSKAAEAKAAADAEFQAWRQSQGRQSTP